MSNLTPVASWDAVIELAGTMSGVPATWNTPNQALLNRTQWLYANSLLKDAGGNVGLGVTPSGWLSYKAFEISASGNAVYSVSAEIGITSNAYHNGGWKYSAVSIAPTRYASGAGQHVWYTAAAGPVGGSITWDARMRLSADGVLEIQSDKSGSAGVYLKNASATGYGARFDGGAAGQYSMSVRTYDGVELFQVSGGGDVLATSGLGGIGYGTGAGGTVTQSTSKSTGVALNKPAGQITMNAAALAANTVVYFTLTDSAIGANDILSVNIHSGNATPGTYNAWAEGNGAGSRVICLRNISAGSLSEAIVLKFAVIKAATA